MRRKYHFLIFSVLFLSLLLQASYLPLPEVRVGIYHNPPLSFLDDSGVPDGFVIELLKEIAKERGWHLTFVPCEWDACLRALEAGKIDLLAPVAFSEERVKRFDFSEETVITNWGQVYVPRGETDISILDLEGKKIALLKGDIHAAAIQSILDEFEIEAEFLFYDDYAAVMQAVEEGEAFGGVVNHLYALQFEDEYQVARSAIIFNPIEVRFAATKGEGAQLLAQLDQSLRGLKADENSLYYEALNRWFGQAAQIGELPRWLFWTGGGTILLVAILLGFAYFLRGKIARQTNALKESEEELALIIDNIPSMVSYLDTDLRYIYADQSYAAWYGFNKEEVMGKTVAEILPPKNYEKVLPRLQEVVATGKPVSYQHHITRVTGEEADVAITYIPRLDATGKTKAFFVTVRDVTEETKTQHALAESEAQYRLLVDNSLVGIYITQDGVLRFANQGLSEIFGYPSPKAMIGTSVRDLIAPRHWEIVRNEMSLKESGEKESSYFRFDGLRLDGSSFNAEVRSHMIPYEGGKAIQGVLADVTEMVVVEERFRALSEASFEAVFISERGICLEQNQAVERLLGYTSKEMLGKPMTDWVVLEDQDRVMHHILSGYEEPYRITARHKDGHTLPVEIRGRMMRYKGRAVHVSGVRDITEQVRAEEQLTASKERFEKVVAQAPIPMVIADANGDIEYYNAEFVETFGYTLEDARTAEEWWQAAYPDEKYREKARRIWERAIEKAAEKGGKIPTQTWEMVAKDGTTRTVEFDMMPLGDFSVIAMNDITARMRIEKSLRESEKKFRDLFEKSQDAHLIIVNGVFVDANQAALNMLGCPDKKALLNRHPAELSPPYQSDGRSSLEKAEEMMRISFEQGSHRFIWDHQRMDGEIIPMEVLLTEIAAEADQKILHVTWKDITEQMEIEKSRRETLERLETLINATPDIICFKDGEGRWLAANDADLKLFELDGVAYFGKTDRELAEYSEFYRDAFLTCEDSDELAWQAGGISRGDEIIPTPIGEDKVYDVIKVPIFSDDNQREGLVVLGRDITEQVHVQRELEKNNRQLEMLNTIAMALSASLELDELLEVILQEAAKVIKFDSASVFLTDENNRVIFANAVGNAKKFIGQSFALEDTLMKGIEEGAKSLFLEDASASPFYQGWEGAESPIRGWIGLPLCARDSLVGYLTLDSCQPGGFNAQDAALAESLAPQIAQAIYNARLYERVIKDANDLEKRVQARTKELQDFVDLTAGREIRMAALKKVISKLRTQLVDAGQVPVADDPLKSDWETSSDSSE